MIRTVEPAYRTPNRPMPRPGAAEAVASADEERRAGSKAGPTGRALVPVNRIETTESGTPTRSDTVQKPSAAFLTQLFAMNAGDPQTRERRRATPEVSSEAYGASIRRPVEQAPLGSHTRVF
ncbi:MAG: hypothetical protein AAF638_02075 [Pseudomonadota bacterium]